MCSMFPELPLQFFKTGLVVKKGVDPVKNVEGQKPSFLTRLALHTHPSAGNVKSVHTLIFLLVTSQISPQLDFVESSCISLKAMHNMMMLMRRIMVQCLYHSWLVTIFMEFLDTWKCQEIGIQSVKSQGNCAVREI